MNLLENKSDGQEFKCAEMVFRELWASDAWFLSLSPLHVVPVTFTEDSSRLPLRCAGADGKHSPCDQETYSHVNQNNEAQLGGRRKLREGQTRAARANKSSRAPFLLVFRTGGLQSIPLSHRFTFHLNSDMMTAQKQNRVKQEPVLQMIGSW